MTLNLAKLLAPALGAVLPGILLTGCESMIYDNEGDCETVYEVQFVYDHNLKRADAFASEVNAVTLHVFDLRSHKLVLTQTETGEALSRPGYAMRINVPAGDYEMVAWCGEGAHDGGHSFSIPSVAHSQPAMPEVAARQGEGPVIGSQPAAPEKLSRPELQCRLQRRLHPETGTPVVDQEGGIRHLYHGTAFASLPKEEGSKVKVQLPLKKMTNSFHILLQSLKGEDVDPNDFVFTIDDNNGLMDWDNALLDDERLTYHAWSQTGGWAEILDPEDDPDGPARAVRAGLGRESSSMSAVVAHFTVGQLIKDKDFKPKLTVRKREDGELLFRVPLIDYALLLTKSGNAKMDDQEYLDRQDEYNMTFFIDDKGTWMEVSIYINGWKQVVQNVDLEDAPFPTPGNM